VTNRAKRRGYTHVLQADFLEWKTDMKFDVVIGNPPYQDDNKTNKIWQHFLGKSSSLLATNGVIGFITPTVWVYRNGSKTKKARQIAEAHGIKYINLTASKHFPGIGEDICSFVLGHTKSTEIIFNTGNVEQILTIPAGSVEDIEFAVSNKIRGSIMRKIEHTKDDRLAVRRDTQSRPNIDIPEGNMSIEPTAEFKYKVWHTSAQQYYVREKLRDSDLLKVVINLSGYYYHHATPEKYIFKSTDASGKGTVHVLVESDDEAERLISVLRSKLYRFYINEEKTSGFNTGVGKLPKVDLTQEWSDQDLYAYFDLTQEEIDYVEANS
jgi:hypothetical protein